MLSFYRELPKAELHLHLEGSVEPETMQELDPSVSPEEARRMYRYDGFAGFIQSYIWVVRKLTGADHYALIARRLFERLDQENVRYAEVNLSAGVILWKQQDLRAIYEAVRDEGLSSPVEVRWIFDAVRQFGAEPAMEVAKIAAEYVDDGVVALGIGGDETAGPAGWFVEVFRWAGTQGLHVAPHAGETAGPESVWAALALGAKRIGHGIRSVEDPDLLVRLRDQQIPCEVCISSNVATGAVRSLQEHPVRKLYDAGVPVVLSTDDPAMFHTTLSNEYRLAAEHFGFTEAELRGIAEAGFKHAFVRK